MLNIGAHKYIFKIIVYYIYIKFFEIYFNLFNNIRALLKIDLMLSSA